MNRWREGAAVFGKAPWHPEFLRGARLSKDLYEFDEWLFRSASRLTPLEPAAPGDAESCGFLLQMEETEDPRCCIAGVLEPSRDQAGRSYPLAVAGAIVFERDIDVHPEVVPIVLETYWDSALDILAAVRSGPTAPDDLRLERLTAGPLDTIAGAYDLYVDWTRRTNTGGLCELLDRPVSWLDRAIETIVETISASGRGEPQRRIDAVRVPLGQAAGGALCFWLDVLRRASRSRVRIPSFFWSYDGHRGEALLFLARGKEAALSTLWRTTTTADDVCDLTLSGRKADEPRLDSGWEAMPSCEADGTLSALLERVDALSSARV